MTLTQLGGFLLATFLFAIGLAMLVRHPARFLVNAVAWSVLVPALWAIVAVAAAAVWIALRVHGG